MQYYSIINIQGDDTMHGVQISFQKPYQIEFRNANTKKGKPQKILDFIYISTEILGPCTSIVSIMNNNKTFKGISLSYFVGLSEKAFKDLNDLLLLDRGSEIFDFYFEEKPFYIIVPPVYPSEENASVQSQDLHFFRASTFDQYINVSDMFVARVHEKKLRGLKVKLNG